MIYLLMIFRGDSVFSEKTQKKINLFLRVRTPCRRSAARTRGRATAGSAFVSVACRARQFPCITEFMRIWSLHPSLLDAKGLVACWRETLLAQKVLEGKTRGYTRHPQLARFRASAEPLALIAAYLASLADEADSRGYSFDRSRIHAAPAPGAIPVTLGQVAYEVVHLRAKLAARAPRWLESPGWAALARSGSDPAAIPLARVFVAVPGDVEPWERRV